MIHDISGQADALHNTQQDASVRVGACGWDPSGLTGFYPDDLPEDWQLGYYANEFTAVWVPASDLPQDEDELETWLDVPEEFRFYIGVNDAEQQDVSATLQRLQPRLGKRLAGVSSVEVGELDETLGLARINVQSRSLREWRVWLEQHAAQLNAVILCDEGLPYPALSDFKSLVEMLNL